MGNSTSEILDRVNSQNLQQLLSYSKGDQDLIDMNEEVFDHGVVSRLEGLDKYDIPGTSS